MLDPDIRSQDSIDEDIKGDLVTFERILDEAGIRTRMKASSGSNGNGRLRPNSKKPDRHGRTGSNY
jgi:hypothetical protein